MPSQTPFTSVKDYENYIARLHQVPKALEQVTANMKLGMANKLMPPKFLLEKVAAQAQSVADGSVRRVRSRSRCRSFPKAFPPPIRNDCATKSSSPLQTEINPAYAKFAAFVKNDYAPKGRTEMGVWSLPDGDARYQQAIKQLTTTGLHAEQIHQMGLKQVAELDAQMLAIAKSQGFADVKSFNEHIRQDPKLHGTSGEQIQGLYQHYTDQMYTKLPQLFGRCPRTNSTSFRWKPIARRVRPRPTIRREPPPARGPAAST